MPPFQLPRVLFLFAATPRLCTRSSFFAARLYPFYIGSLHRSLSSRFFRFPSSPHLGIYTIPYRVEVRYDRLEKFTINLRRKFVELYTPPLPPILSAHRSRKITNHLMGILWTRKRISFDLPVFSFLRRNMEKLSGHSRPFFS